MQDIVVQPKYEYASSFSCGYAVVKNQEKYKFINTKGKNAFSAVYEDANPFSENLAAVKIGKKYGYINKKGKLVIKPIYDYAYVFSEGKAFVVKKGQPGFINTKGKFLFKAPKGTDVGCIVICAFSADSKGKCRNSGNGIFLFIKI